MKQKHRYLFQRMGLTLLSLWAVLTLLFLLFRTLPGNPASVLLPPNVSEEQRQALLQSYGLNQPLPIQYVKYLENVVLHADFGRSFVNNQKVFPYLLDKAINTISVTVTALVLAFLIGPIIGAFMAWNRGGVVDKYGTGLVLATWATPVFWTGLVSLMIFSFHLEWLPSSGMHSVTYTGDGLVDRFVSVDFLRHAILPISVYFLARISQPVLFMRNNMLEVLGSEFIELKRAEGLSERNIRIKHAARNSLLPVLHYAALALGFAFGGSVILETVFSWPGIGRALWNAVLQRDYPVAQGAFFLIAFMIISLNFLIDALSVYIDPRVAEEGDHS